MCLLVLWYFETTMLKIQGNLRGWERWDDTCVYKHESHWFNQLKKEHKMNFRYLYSASFSFQEKFPYLLASQKALISRLLLRFWVLRINTYAQYLIFDRKNMSWDSTGTFDNTRNTIYCFWKLKLDLEVYKAIQVVNFFWFHLFSLLCILVFS